MCFNGRSLFINQCILWLTYDLYLQEEKRISLTSGLRGMFTFQIRLDFAYIWTLKAMFGLGKCEGKFEITKIERTNKKKEKVKINKK